MRLHAIISKNNGEDATAWNLHTSCNDLARDDEYFVRLTKVRPRGTGILYTVFLAQVQPPCCTMTIRGKPR